MHKEQRSLKNSHTSYDSSNCDGACINNRPITWTQVFQLNYVISAVVIYPSIALAIIQITDMFGPKF